MDAQVLFGVLFGFGHELFHGGVLGLQDAVHEVFVVGEFAEDLVQGGVGLFVDHTGRHFEGGVGQHLVQHGVPDSAGLFVLQVGDGLFPQVGAEFVDGVEFGGQLHEVFVDFGQGAVLHGIDGDGDGVVVFREGDFVTLVFADDGIVEAVHEVFGAHLIGQGVGGEVVDRVAFGVDGFDVDGDEVVFGDRLIYVRQLGEPFPQPVEFFVHGFFFVAQGGHLHGHLVEVGQGDVGAHINLGGEFDDVTVFDLGEVEFGLA